MKKIRTDLAYERCRGIHTAGSHYREEKCGPFYKHTLTVETKTAADRLDCKIGTYHTLLFKCVMDFCEEEYDLLTDTVASLLTEMSEPMCQNGIGRVLIAGLGNRNMAADALGPRAAEHVYATAHMEDIAKRAECCAIGVTVPDVTANSGMESADAVQAIAKMFRPDLVVAVDALIAGSLDRLGCTVQITDTGITPGSGLGQRHGGLDKSTLGCPVLAIGAPTVAALSALKENIQNECFVICPKDIDGVCRSLARVVGEAINRAFGIPFRI